jgi:O-antigen/teichoic acid export membrane protein
MADDVAASSPRRFRSDVLWNIAALGVAGVAGVLLHVFVGIAYGKAPLGVFNQVFAVYIVASQLAVLGLHFAALKFVAEHEDRPAVASAVMRAALLGVVLLALPVAGVVAWLAEPISGWLDSPAVREGLWWAVPGLVLFAVNKVLFAGINGRRLMRWFAVLTALRPVAMTATAAGLWLADAPPAMLGLVLTVGEAAVLPWGLGVLTPMLLARPSAPPPWQGGAGGGSAVEPPMKPDDERDRKLDPHPSPLPARERGPDGSVRWWIPRLFNFGIRGFATGMLSELNTRVDVLMLGWLASDAVVGLYSFAAIAVEGLYQLLVVLRNNYNPLLVQRLAAGDRQGVRALARRGKLAAWGLMSLVGLAAVLLMPPALWLLGADQQYAGATTLLAILMLGVVLGAGYTPFGTVLMQAGRPGAQTLLTLGLVALNIAGNALLIPRYGAVGAAIATGASFVAAAVLVAAAARLVLKVRL